MTIHAPHKSSRPHPAQRSHAEHADDPEPGLLPVEPDQGPVPDGIPAGPEPDRTLDPQA